MGRNWKRTIRIRERLLTERPRFELALRSLLRRVAMRICKCTRHLPDVRLMVRVVLRNWSRSRFIRYEDNCTQGNCDEPTFHNDLLRFCDHDGARRAFAPLSMNRV
jgi:hypothetical protein